MALNDKQARFVEEYLVDLNATQSAIRAGYSEKTAGQQGFELLKKPEIQEAIAEAKAVRSRRTQITQDRVLQELAKIGFSDLRRVMTSDGALLSPHEWDDDIAGAVSSVEVVTVYRGEEDEDGNKVPEHVHKMRVWDKNSALEKIGKHLGMFTDKIEHGGKIQTEETGQGAAKLAAFLDAISSRTPSDTDA